MVYHVRLPLTYTSSALQKMVTEVPGIRSPLLVNKNSDCEVFDFSVNPELDSLQSGSIRMRCWPLAGAAGNVIVLPSATV